LKCKNTSADSTQEILVNPLTKRQVDLEKIKNKKFKKRLAFSVNVLYIK